MDIKERMIILSNHVIGYGLNSVAKVVIELFDSGEISEKVAKRLLIACREGVHWGDGNEYEAIECLREYYCGKCLKKMKPGDELYSIWDVSPGTNKKYNMYDVDSNDIISDRLCSSCFDEILTQKSGDENLGYKERKYIKKEYGKNHCKVE